VAIGESDGKSFVRKRIVMKTPEAAQQVKAVNDGFKALLSLSFAGDADMMKLVDASTCTVRESTVNVRWEVPSEDVWNAIEKVAKKVEAHIKKMQEGRKEKGKDKDEDKHEQDDKV
jgi:ribosome-associated translation inhibitor RaiA